MNNLSFVNKKGLTLLILTVIITIIASACTTPQTAPQDTAPTVDVEALTESIISTVSSQVTQDAVEAALTQAAQPTATSVPTATAVPTEVPTEEPEPTEETAPTNTAAPPPVPTATSAAPSSSSTTGCIYVASFNSNVTVPAGTTYAPGAEFIKSWKVTNNGNCSWDTDFKIIFSSGEQMGGPSSISFNTGTVKPGQTVTLSLKLFAPADEGNYTGYWLLQTDMGEVFGIGTADNPLSVNINVDN